MRLALNPLGAKTAHPALDEPDPHAAVDVGGLRTLRNERAQRTGRRCDHCRVPVDPVERRLEAERADRGADALEPRLEPRLWSQVCDTRELAAEILTGPAKRRLAPLRRHLVEQARHQDGEAAGRELEDLRLRRSRIELRRAPGAGTASAGATGEACLEQTGAKEPLEPAAGDASVHPQRSCSLVRVNGRGRPAHIQQHRTQLTPTDRVETIQRRWKD